MLYLDRLGSAFAVVVVSLSEKLENFGGRLFVKRHCGIGCKEFKNRHSSKRYGLFFTIMACPFEIFTHEKDYNVVVIVG